MKLRLLFPFFIFFVSLVFAVSCASRKPAKPVVLQNMREVVQTVHDTVFHTQADSAFYHAYIDCRDGRPVIIKDSIIYKPGKNTETKVYLRGNKLNVDCKKQAESFFKQWRETYIKEHEQKPIYVQKPVYKDKPFSLWQKTQIWFGRILMGLLAISILIGILRRCSIL